MNNNPHPTVTPETAPVKEEQEGEKGGEKEENCSLYCAHSQTHTASSGSSARSVHSVATLQHSNVSSAGLRLGADRSRLRAALRKMMANTKHVQEILSALSGSNATTRDGAYDPVGKAVAGFLSVVESAGGSGTAKAAASVTIRQAGTQTKADITAILSGAEASARAAIRRSAAGATVQKDLVRRAASAARSVVEDAAKEIRTALDGLADQADSAAETAGLVVGTPLAMLESINETFPFIDGLSSGASTSVLRAYSNAMTGTTTAAFLDSAAEAVIAFLQVVSNDMNRIGPSDSGVEDGSTDAEGPPAAINVVAAAAVAAQAHLEADSSEPASKRQRTTGSENAAAMGGEDESQSHLDSKPKAKPKANE